MTTPAGGLPSPALDSAPEVSGASALSLANLLAVYLPALADRERRALTLIEVGRLTYTEAAERLNASAEDVRRLVFQARLRLYAATSPTLDELEHRGRTSR